MHCTSHNGKQKDKVGKTDNYWYKEEKISVCQFIAIFTGREAKQTKTTVEKQLQFGVQIMAICFKFILKNEFQYAFAEFNLHYKKLQNTGTKLSQYTGEGAVGRFHKNNMSCIFRI